LQNSQPAAPYARPMTSSATFRADHVGSLLRPLALLGARQRRDAGAIGAGELRAIEDDAIAAVVAAQQETGISVLTDGEFRRRDFRTGFVEAVDGITMRTFDMPWQTSAGMTKLPSKSFTVIGRLKQCGFASVAEGGNQLTPGEQFAKLRLVADTARAIWGQAG
jgi:methionine synthase II (cobalamin-independent)